MLHVCRDRRGEVVRPYDKKCFLSSERHNTDRKPLHETVCYEEYREQELERAEEDNMFVTNYFERMILWMRLAQEIPHILNGLRALV